MFLFWATLVMFGMKNYLYIAHVKRVADVSRSLSIGVGSNVDQIHKFPGNTTDSDIQPEILLFDL